MNMLKKRGKAQSWSLDIILAFVVFVLIIALLYAVLSSNTNQDFNEVELEAKTIVSNLDSETAIGNNELSIIEKGSINEDKLEQLYSKNYSEVKRDLNIKGDFCIYIVDYNGNVLAINSTDGKKNGFGSELLEIGGTGCGSIVE